MGPARCRTRVAPLGLIFAAILAPGCGAEDSGSPEAEPAPEPPAIATEGLEISSCRSLPLHELDIELDGVDPVAVAKLKARGPATPELKGGVVFTSAKLDNGEIATWVYVESAASRLAAGPVARQVSSQGAGRDPQTVVAWGVGPESKGYAASRECVSGKDAGGEPVELPKAELGLGETGTVGSLAITPERIERNVGASYTVTFAARATGKRAIEPFCVGGADLIDTSGRRRTGEAVIGSTPNCERLPPGAKASGYEVVVEIPNGAKPAVLEAWGGNFVNSRGDALTWDVAASG